MKSGAGATTSALFAGGRMMAHVLDDMNKYVGAQRRDVGTQSSILVSSSKYLNNPLIRGALPNFMLRKNGQDVRTEADHTLGLYAGFEEVRDHARIEELLTRERKINPQLDQWLGERFLSSWTNEDFAKYPEGSLGGLMYRQIRDFGFDITLGRTSQSKQPETQYEYALVRGGQIHDFEHILLGSSFDSIGEIIPLFSGLANRTKHFSPEVSHIFNEYQIFSAIRIFARSGLHYPETFAASLESVELGIRVGQASDCYMFAKYEDLLGLTPIEVRKELGIREVVDFHTTREGLIFQEDGPSPSRAAD